MELRSQDKEKGIANPFGFISLNGDSSSNQLSSSPSHLAVEGIGDQTLDHHHFPYNHQQLNQPHKPRKESESEPKPNTNTNPDPVFVSPIARTIATTITVPNARGSSSSSLTIRYKECLKNHAAATGGHVLDGCGEFMPSGEEGTTESLKCAACDCHRSFHRKESEGESYYVTNSSYNRRSSMPQQTTAVVHPYHHRFNAELPAGLAGNPPTMMVFGSGSGGGVADSSSGEDLNNFDQLNYSTGAHASVQQKLVSNKRFRTKFSTDQKDKMMEFAEKLGWRIQKHDEHEVHQFCSQVGVKRQVFKVWMHNNKQAMRKKQ